MAKNRLTTPYDVEQKNLRVRTKNAFASIMAKLIDVINIGDVDLWEEIDGKFTDAMITYREQSMLRVPVELLRSFDEDQESRAASSPTVAELLDEIGIATSY